MLSEFPPIVVNTLIGLVALALLALFWRSTRGSKALETGVMRVGLLLLLAPFAIAAVIGSLHKQEGPGQAAKPESVAVERSAPSPAPAPSSVPEARQAPPQPPVSAAPPPPPVPPAPQVAPTPQPAPAPQVSPPPLREAATPPPPTQSAAQPPPAAAPETAAPPKAAAVQSAEPWDVVPVYYGTDRAAETVNGQPNYGAERARRLELGRALVTVPKVHEVPNVERPWVYRLPFTRIILYQELEDPAKHFTLKEIKVMSREELAQIVRDRLGASTDYKDQALVFLHGFNNGFENALFRTAQIAYDLKFDGAPFMYSWPSKGQLGLQDYSYDRESSGQAEPYLKQFLEFVTRETGAKTVNIIAHSMGNQLLLNVLRDLKQSAPTDVRIGQVILAAPDVDRDTFEFLAKEISGYGQGLTMLAASNDRALEISKRFWGGVPRAGDVPTEGPVVIAGIDTIDITALSTDVLALNHSGYAEKHQLLDDMRRLIREGTRPPDKRVPALEIVTTAKGSFWRYRAQP